MTNDSLMMLMKVELLQNAPLGAFCNAFDLHYATIGLDNQFFIILRLAVLHRFNCTVNAV